MLNTETEKCDQDKCNSCETSYETSYEAPAPMVSEQETVNQREDLQNQLSDIEQQRADLDRQAADIHAQLDKLPMESQQFPVKDTSGREEAQPAQGKTW